MAVVIIVKMGAVDGTPIISLPFEAFAATGSSDAGLGCSGSGTALSSDDGSSGIILSEDTGGA